MAKYEPVSASLDTDVDEANEDNETEDLPSIEKGISPYVAGAFIVAEIAGAGILALPKALTSLGYPGIILFGLVGIVMLYTGILLGNCWIKVYGAKTGSEPIRDPYPKIAEAAFGKFARVAVITLVLMHCFFVAAIYIIMPSQMIATMLNIHFPGVSEINGTRLWSFLFAVVITPLTWFESPKDNWLVAIVGSLTTFVSVACIIVGFILLPVSSWTNFMFDNRLGSALNPIDKFSVSLGIFIASFTGAVIFPTIQTDMKKPKLFSRALVIGYLGCTAFYIPVMLGGAIIFDGYTKDNVLLSLISAVNISRYPALFKGLIYTGTFSFLFHFAAGAVIQSNPINQLIESYTNIPEGWSCRRCMIRTGFMVAVVLLAVLVPNFTPILSFLGGTINMLLSIVFPASFFLALHEDVSKSHKVLIGVIIITGLFLTGLIGYINSVGMYHSMTQ